MGVQLNSSKFKSNDLTRMIPSRQNPSKPFKLPQNSSSRQTYPVAESCMRDDSGGLGLSSPDCSRPNPASEAIIAKRTVTNHAASMPLANRRVPKARRMARRRSRACHLLSRRTKSGVSSLILSSLPYLSHTHATSWLTDTHTIPLRGRVYVCVTINTTSPCHPSKPHSTHPSLYRRGVLCVLSLGSMRQG